MTTQSKNRQGNEKISFRFISKESITKAFEGQKRKQQEKERIHGIKGKRSSKEARLLLTSNSRFQLLSGIALSSQLLFPVPSFLTASPDTFGETAGFCHLISEASSSELQTPLLHP